jgi:hypothetical protein
VEIRRTERNRQEPAVKGEGDVFIIPADLLPDNLESGSKVKMIIEGTFNSSDEGGTIQIDKIYPEKSYQRTDPLQDSIERGIDIELNIK